MSAEDPASCHGHGRDCWAVVMAAAYVASRPIPSASPPQPNWASSALDRRQRLTLTPIYEWKPFKNSNWFVKNMVGNWIISGTYTYQSPEYATVQSGLDSNLNKGVRDQRNGKLP